MSNEANNAMRQANLEALVDTVKKEMPNEVRKADIVAEIRRIHYDASIRKGFTPAEALTLCMKPTL